PLSCVSPPRASKEHDHAKSKAGSHARAALHINANTAAARIVPAGDFFDRASAPNPKFARQCRESNCELRVQRGTRIIELAVSPLIPKFACECAARVCELRNRDTAHVGR